MDAADILVLAGRRDAVAFADGLGASTLRLSAALPAPRREVAGPFDSALGRGWRGVICAAHPFDPAPAARVAALWPDLPCALHPAPAWGAEVPGSAAWAHAPDVAAAVRAMPPGLRLFAATGRESEAALAGYDGTVFLRQNSLHNAPPSAPNVRYHFTLAADYDEGSEAALFQARGIGALILRNTGGRRGLGKVLA
ncbi:MAG: hypothetical protein AAGF60_16410, partial [Pseudomonadota bacterium]